MQIFRQKGKEPVGGKRFQPVIGPPKLIVVIFDRGGQIAGHHLGGVMIDRQGQDVLGIHGTYIGNTAAVIAGMVYEYLPFMVLPVYTVMSKIDPGLIEAAQDLGAGNASVFGKVILPLSIPGVISGVTMVFVPSASTFLVSQYLGGTDDIMIGDVIDKIFWTDENTGAAISLVMMVFIFVFLVIMNLFGDEEAIA